MRVRLPFFCIAICLSMTAMVNLASVNAQNLSQSTLPQANAFLDVSFKHKNAFIDDVQFNEINIKDPKNVRAVAMESIGELPLNIAILLDTSDSQHRSFNEVLQFYAEMIELLPLRSHDAVSLITVDSQIKILQGGTSNKLLLRNGFENVLCAGATRLFDAIYSVGDAFGEKEGSRKAMILLSNGIDSISTRTKKEAFQKAAANNVRVYLFAKNDQPYGASPGGENEKSINAKYIKITGGSIFTFINLKSAKANFIQVMDELNHLKRISLSIDPLGAPISGLKISVSRKGVNTSYPFPVQYIVK